MLDIPLVGPDGIADLGDGGDEGAFITLAGVENSDNVFGTVAGVQRHLRAAGGRLQRCYEAEYGKPPGAYSALAYACTQVLLQAIDANIGSARPTWRRSARLSARQSSPATEWDTVLGTIHFDANGDSSQKWISFYKTTRAQRRHGGWDLRQAAGLRRVRRTPALARRPLKPVLQTAGESIRSSPAVSYLIRVQTYG